MSRQPLAAFDCAAGHRYPEPLYPYLETPSSDMKGDYATFEALGNNSKLAPTRAGLFLVMTTAVAIER
jgi:hypothetical protein